MIRNNLVEEYFGFLKITQRHRAVPNLKVCIINHGSLRELFSDFDVLLEGGTVFLLSLIAFTKLVMRKVMNACLSWSTVENLTKEASSLVKFILFDQASRTRDLLFR